MNDFLSPQPLQKGQTIYLVSTARKLSPEDIKSAVHIFKQWGLNVKLGEHLFSESGQFAGSDQERIADFQNALNDPDVHAIICARGGYGTTRILDELDFRLFLQKPKWVSGFSDITALHSHLHHLQVQSVHSTMPICFDTDNEISINSLKKILFGEAVSYQAPLFHLNRHGQASGLMIGGNLSVISSVIGTSSDANTDGKILFIEDTDEYLYHIDRMMIHLKRAGKLTNLAGLVVGSFTKMHDNGVPFGKPVEQIVFDCVKEFDYPVCFNFPTGHTNSNVAIPCGRNAVLDINETDVSLKFE